MTDTKLSISNDRIILLAIAAMAAFSAFKDTQSETNSELKLEITKQSSKISAFEGTMARVEGFMSKPRFTPEDFTIAMKPYETRLARIEQIAHDRGEVLNNSRDDHLEQDAEIKALNFRLSILEQEGK